jgi:uncharacterized membrane protein YfcA
MVTTMPQDGLATVCGALVGFSLALTGGGGSILAVPLLLYVVGLHDVHVVIGTSALAVAVNAYANLLPHARAGHVRWREAGVFTIAGMIGAFIGSELGKLMEGRHLQALFALLMIVVAVLMLIPRRQPAYAGKPVRFLALRLAAAGTAAGALAGFFGIGGGFLIVPGLMLASRMQIIDAIGTSLFGVGSFGLTTALSYARSGLIDWPIAAAFIAGGIVGGWVGSLAARRLAQTRGALNAVFSAMIVVVAIYMLLHTPQHPSAMSDASASRQALRTQARFAPKDASLLARVER